MTEFTKTKMHFALAVIGALFGLHNLLVRYEPDPLPVPYYDWSKEEFRDWNFSVFHVHGMVMALLALAVYFYAMVLMSEGSHQAERAGNYAYALAILLVPLYGFLYLSHVIGSTVLGEEWVRSHLGRAAPLGVVVAGLVVFLLLARRLRRRLGERDRGALLGQLHRLEVESLRHARELFQHEHYDLSVIEAWKTVEARLRRALLGRGENAATLPVARLIDTAQRRGLVTTAGMPLLQELRQHWGVASGTEPLKREAAEAALHGARHLLATVPVEETTKAGVR